MQSDTDRQKTKPRSNNSGRNLTIVVMVLAIILLMSLVLIFYISGKIDSMSNADSQIKLSAQGGFNCEYSEAQKLYPFGEGVLKVTNERIAYLTLSGNDIYTAQISYQNPQCVTFGEYAVVFDLDGYNFTLVTADSIVYSKPTVNQIKAVTVSSTGVSAVITNSPDSYGEVLLFDASGNAISEWSSYNSGYPLACAFNDDSTVLAVSTINTNGALVVPYIRQFSLTYGEKGVEVQDKAIYSTEDSVVFSSLFFVGDNLYCFSSDSIYQVKDEQIMQLNFDFAVVGRVVKVKDNLFVTYSDGISQMNKLAVINSNNTVVYNSSIGSEINAICTNGSLYAISVNKRVFVYNASGTVINDFSVDEDILRLNFISGDKLCIVSTSGVHTIN
ncbi:MAG: DUF5711 family protein [Saccharofermentans sp.]|nr:DUF5711 family protein [Saccharofermentans sp.]